MAAIRRVINSSLFSRGSENRAVLRTAAKRSSSRSLLRRRQRLVVALEQRLVPRRVARLRRLQELAPHLRRQVAGPADVGRPLPVHVPQRPAQPLPRLLPLPRPVPAFPVRQIPPPPPQH